MTVMAPADKEIEAEVLELLSHRKLWFPSPPAAVVQLSTLLANEDVSLKEVVRIVRTHPLLSAKLLQVANSAALNTGTQLVRVEDAIQRLGSSFVRNLALSITLQEQFHPSDPFLIQITTTLWLHSVDTGAHCLMLTNHINEIAEQHLDGSLSLLVGMIHNIGELPLLAYAVMKHFSVNAMLTLDQQLRRHLSLVLLEKWGLPEQITDAVSRRNQYGEIFDYAHAYLDGNAAEEANIAGVDVSKKQFEEYVNKEHETLAQFKAFLG